MKRHFSEKQIVELTVFCGMWNYSNRLCEALHVDLERPDKRIEFQTEDRRHAMAETKTYTGGCHCGEVRFEVTADISSVVSCNCSLCQKRGALWSFVTAGEFRAARRRGGPQGLPVRQEDHPSSVLRAMRRGRHSRAATSPKGGEMVAVNVRCLDDVDIAALKVTLFDGRSL